MLSVIVEVSGDFNGAGHIMVRVGVIGCRFDLLEQVGEVLVRDRELFEKAIILEKFEPKVN